MIFDQYGHDSGTTNMNINDFVACKNEFHECNLAILDIYGQFSSMTNIW